MLSWDTRWSVAARMQFCRVGGRTTEQRRWQRRKRLTVEKKKRERTDEETWNGPAAMAGLGLLDLFSFPQLVNTYREIRAVQEQNNQIFIREERSARIEEISTHSCVQKRCWCRLRARSYLVFSLWLLASLLNTDDPARKAEHLAEKCKQKPSSETLASGRKAGTPGTEEMQRRSRYFSPGVCRLCDRAHFITSLNNPLTNKEWRQVCEANH